MSIFEERAIDPMALILPTSAYLIWVEIHHPHEPALSKVAQVVKTLKPEEKKFALAKANAMAAYANAVVEALKGERL